MTQIDHIPGVTFHGRHGAVDNRFRYRVDYLLLDAETKVGGPRLFSRNAANLTSLHDRDHGGAPARGRGAAWVRDVLDRHGLGRIADGPILLLAQPRVLGHVFNPVSFWLVHDAAGRLRAVLPEVSNTFGDRHSYLCVRDDAGPITADDRLTAAKVFHVSPFQPISGGYTFTFDISPDHVSIRIDFRDGTDAAGGVLATLAGPRRPLTTRAILAACLRRPFGSRRVLGLIHWQAVKLWWKGATFRPRPAPPAEEISGR